MHLEGFNQLRNPVTSLGFDPATFWLVALCLNQPHYRVSPHKSNAVQNEAMYKKIFLVRGRFQDHTVL
jgi:hypothetical protein